MTQKILLSTDLDRTLLPNGPQPESPEARPRFTRLAAHPEVTLAYVSGRHLALVEQAIDEYALPAPDYIIADVGTTIYEHSNMQWHMWDEWYDEIDPDWGGMSHEQIFQLFTDITELTLQEASKQGVHKLSYYAPMSIDHERLLDTMQARLVDRGVSASLIWSVDEASGTGLLDVLPERATKLHAIEFLMQRKGFSLKNTVFAGDSGNDLPVLTSPLHSVLVANATDAVRKQAQEQAKDKQTLPALYFAQGNFHSMNGNYSAGILEGLAHYIPETENWW